MGHHKKMSVALLLLATLLGLVAAGPPVCFVDRKFCFQANVVNNNVTMQFNFTTKGWVAVGIGSSMSDADIYMVWNTASNRFTVDDRRSTGQSTPRVDPTKNVALISAVLGDPNSNKPHSVTATRPVNTGDSNDKPFINGKMKMIWAYSNSPVSGGNPDIHDERGSFEYNVFENVAFGGTPVEVKNSGLNRTTGVVTHGVLMFIAWGLCSHIAIFVARFMKAKLGGAWFKIHRGLFVLVSILSIVGFVLIYMATAAHFANTHAIIGLVVLILMVAQTVLGFVIDKLFDAARSAIPWWDKLHWWLGRLLAVGAPVNIILGLLEYNVSNIYITLFVVSWVFFIVLFAYGQFKIGQTHDHKPSSDHDKSANMSDVTIGFPQNTHSSVYNPNGKPLPNPNFTEQSPNGYNQPYMRDTYASEYQGDNQQSYSGDQYGYQSEENYNYNQGGKGGQENYYGNRI